MLGERLKMVGHHFLAQFRSLSLQNQNHHRVKVYQHSWTHSSWFLHCYHYQGPRKPFDHFWWSSTFLDNSLKLWEGELIILVFVIFHEIFLLRVNTKVLVAHSELDGSRLESWVIQLFWKDSIRIGWAKISFLIIIVKHWELDLKNQPWILDLVKYYIILLFKKTPYKILISDLQIKILLLFLRLSKTPKYFWIYSKASY